MKFKISKDKLNIALQKVAAAVAPRAPIPVLANIRFVAEEGLVRLAASNLDLSVEAVVPAHVLSSGATTLPARLVPSIVRDAPAEELEFERRDNEITEIVAGPAVFSLRGISAEDFPTLPDGAETTPFVMEQSLLRAILQRVGYAASTDDSRKVLTGTFVRFKEGRFTAVATDGRRLALVDQSLEDVEGDAFEIILPTKAVNELVRSLGVEGTVRIRTTSSQAVFETDELVISTKLVEGTYPNFQQVIPSQGVVRVVAERELFMNAVRRVALLTSDRCNSVRLNFGANRVEILVSSVEFGEARETVPVKYDGEKMTIAFNPALLIEPLRYLVSDEITIELSGPTSPGVIKTDEPFLYVIMPMMIS